MLLLSVVTPERKVVEAECEEVTLPGELGYFGILPGHASLLASLATGVVSWKEGNRTSRLALSGGFCEVSGDRVSVLADLAESPDEIDVEAAKSSRAAAEEKMKTATHLDIDRLRAEVELASARIGAASPDKAQNPHG